MKSKSDLETIIKEVKQQQKNDSNLNQIRRRLSQQDERITPFYCVHEDTLFVKTSHTQNSWKLVIPRGFEKEIIMDYYLRYGHMGALKVIKALEEHTYVKDINRRVRNYIKHCHISVSYTHLDVYKRQV